MSGQSCGNCDAFLLNTAVERKPGEPPQGWCRAKPPQLVQVMVPVSSPLAPQGAKMVPGWQGLFVPASTDMWCREWRAVWAKNARKPQTIELEASDAADQPSAP